MKNLIFIIFLLVPGLCFAELYVVVDKNTNEVITASDKNDTIAGQGQELKVMGGQIADFTSENPTNYKLVNGKFIKNIDKIDKQEQVKIAQAEQLLTEKLIQAKIKEQAIAALKEEGKLDKEGKIVE